MNSDSATRSGSDESGISGAVTNTQFKHMQERDDINILDWHEIGLMGEFDVFVSYEHVEETSDRIQFTCKDCGKEVDREPHHMDVDGMTPVRCSNCTLERMAE